jgi:heme exporter protein A
MTALFSQFPKPTKIEAYALGMSRGQNVLFEDLSVTISSGDVLWIQGDNGIGKTTFLEALAGLSRPDEGNLHWYIGDSLVTPSHLVSYQPHRSFAKASLTVREDLMFWASIYGRKDLVDEALDRVNLSNRKTLATQGLSAGQKRRLALAKLAVSNKATWVMDEPTAPMDMDGAKLIDGFVTQHIKRGGSAIIASHATPRALSINTRKLVLKAA